MSEQTLLALCLTVVVAPLVGFVIQYAGGRRLPGQGAWLTVGTIGVSLGCAIAIALDVLQWGDLLGMQFDLGTWLPAGDGAAWNLGITLDGLTAVMLVVVSGVSFLVHLFSVGYMKGDAKYPLFFAWLQMFSVSMLILVLADNLLHLFMGWELVGLCSYKLIGFWSEKQAPCDAARKAFITTRIGDLGMLLAICIIGGAVGSFSFKGIEAAVAGGSFHGVWLSVAGFGLLFAAMGKSAQIGLHVWLPDAMEGPTPVSALIHAATMVAAGVYLIGRMAFMLTPEVLTVTAIVGAVTALVAGCMALAQDDIKRVLAYSTVSQLGYMFLGLGVGAWHAALFHLTTHAFFKALMFLGSGSVIHACHHEQDMRKMGGLWKKLPITGTTFFLGVIAISGVPWITSGFFSKDGILSGAYAVQPVLFWMGLAGAVLTAFYMVRLFAMTFLGSPKDEHVHEHAHESPMVMTIPLVVLGVLAVCAGWGTWHELLLAPPTSVAGAALQSRHEEHHHAGAVAPLAIAAALLGLLLGAFVFWKSAARVPDWKKPFRALETAFAHKFWFDEFYAKVLVQPAYKLAEVFRFVDSRGVDGLVNAVGRGGVKAGKASGAHDRRVVDGLVRLTGATAQGLGSVVSMLQSGRVRFYLSLSVGALALALLLERIF